MRQGQQGKRMRGRSGRKGGGNPANRSYESNGPDVKVRGTASHIAEKYVQLARDAATAGDPVASENYLQHAEHYLRIVAAAAPQEQRQPNVNADDSNEDDNREANGDTEKASASEAEQPSELSGAEAKGEAADQDSGSEQQADSAPRPRRARRPRRNTVEAASDDAGESKDDKPAAAEESSASDEAPVEISAAE